MAQYICATKDLIGSSSDCADLGGWYLAKYAKFSEINWAAILEGAPTTFDTTTRKIHEFPLIVGATWKTVQPRGEGTNYVFNFARITRYDCTVNFVFDGKNEIRTANFQEALLCCDLVFVLFCNNGKHRVVGVDYNGEAFVLPYRNFNFSTIADNSGTIGTDGATDVVALNGVQLFAPLFSDAPLADF